MFKALYSHVNNIIEKYYKFTTISYYIYNELKQLLNHLIHNEKLKLTEYMQIYKNNDLLLLNLVNKYVLSDLLKLEMVLEMVLILNQYVSLTRSTCSWLFKLKVGNF